MDRDGTLTSAPAVVSLDDAAAAQVALTGAKAANLSRARLAGLPVLRGAVLTTAWSPSDRRTALAAWRAVSGGGEVAVVVRSSSTGEDGGASSMAGVFDSILDVRDEASFTAAIDAVLDSAAGAANAGVVDADMAVLVQPMLQPAWGGVLFGADPVTGRRDRLVVAAVPSGPAALVSGEVDGWTGVLSRRGRVVEVRSGTGAVPPRSMLHRLADLAGEVAATFGGPQDIEWAVEVDGTVRLLQARPITTLAPRTGPVLGAGPVAESFPDPLYPLEQELWLDPLRDGLREALRLAGTSPQRRLERSPLVVAVSGRAVVDLDALGIDEGTRRSVLRRLDPRPPARRLRAAWRVGRLRRALPDLAADLVQRTDADLAAVPSLDQLGNAELLALLRNARRSLTSLHGHEALSGLLIPEAAAATVTGASLALAAVAEVGAEGVSFCDLVERDPVVLALIPPHIGPGRDMDEVLGAAGAVLARPDTALQADPDPASVAREALRLRIRWLQELTARAAWELGRRLVDVGVLPAQDAIRLLSFGELQSAVQRRTVPADLAERSAPDDRSLPARFRLTEDGSPVAVPNRGRPRRGSSIDLSEAVGAGGGIGQGPVHIGSVGTETPAGSVLVVGHLDPRLAPSIPRLAGLVAETGNALSHLAILAREHGVPTVVGLAGATERFRDGATVIVDGQAGTVQVVHTQSPHSEKAPAGADFEDEDAGLAINGAPS